MSQVFNAVDVAGGVLQIILLFLLLSGGLRKFPLLFLYAVVQLLATMAETTVRRQFGIRAAQYVQLYWADEILLDLLLFLMVIAFTYQALEGNPLRAKTGKFLATVVVLAVVAPFLLYYHRVLFTTPWFNGTSQWLNFSAAIMNLALWTALLSNKKRDPQLLTVSIGLGVAVTGAAMSFGLRQFMTRGYGRQFADLVGVLTSLAGVFVWCWAFRPAWLRDRPKRPKQPPNEPSPLATTSGY
jgi:hypothetical protein